jgi:putative ABC transport system permease protein
MLNTLGHEHVVSVRQRWQRASVALVFALQSIWSARRRMWLVVLGAAIGFGAIDSMLIIGHSVQVRIQSSLDSLGGDIVTLGVTSAAQEERLDAMKGERPKPRRAAPMTTANADAVDTETLGKLINNMPQVQGIAWVNQGGRSCSSSADDVQDLHQIQVPLAVQSLLSLKLAEGRFLHPGDLDQPNMLLGAAAMEALRTQRPGTGVGSQIQACGLTYRVIGVLQPHPGSDFVQALQINSSAMMARHSPDADTSGAMKSLLVKLHTGTAAQNFAMDLTARAQQLLPGYSVQAEGAWEFIKLRQEQASLYARFLAVLGSVSLLVGTLGIANMMLVTVSERRAEIGLRMAIGAKRTDIVAQFLCEGVLICLVGAAVGLLLGWGVAQIALNLGGFDAVLSASVIAKASLLAIGCGIISGAYPAYRAAAVEPVSSLQG